MRGIFMINPEVLSTMNDLRYQRTDRRTWSLVDASGNVLGKFIKPSWMSRRGELIVPSGPYEVKPLKPWSLSVGCFFGDAPLRAAKFNWRGADVRDAAGELLYSIVPKGWFSSTYRIVDNTGLDRYTLRSRMVWTRFDREHELTHTGGEPFEPLDLLFLLQVIIINQDRAGAAAAA